MVKINPEEYTACPIGPPPWHYKCNNCGHEFEMPVPSGPSEEKARTCPSCHSPSIERIKTVKWEACPPGG